MTAENTRRTWVPWPAAFIDDLVFTDKEEQEILDKHKISRRRYYAWLGDARFLDRLQNRIQASRNRNTLRIARHAAKAVDKIIDTLADSRSTAARKARLDLITLDKGTLKTAAADASADRSTPQPQTPTLTPEQRNAVLAALARTND